MRLDLLRRRFSRHVDVSGDEAGSVLPIALGIMLLLAILVTSIVFYSTSNSTAAEYSSQDNSAYSLAEEGLNDALSVLNGHPDANSASLLPASSSGNPSHFGVDGLNVYGDYNAGTHTWTLTSTDHVKNLSGSSSPVTRTETAIVPLTAAPIQTLDQTNAGAWNWLYENSGSANDSCSGTEWIDGNAIVSAPVYAKGDLCMNSNNGVNNEQSYTVAPITVDTQGYLRRTGNGSLGSPAGSPTGVVAAVHPKLGCKNGTGGGHICTSADHVYATTSDYNNAAAVVSPVVDRAYWYTNASPGPNHPCTTTSGTPPQFDTDHTRNTSNPSQWLTPANSYSCKTSTGELSWDASTDTLTIKGAIFFDGPITIGGPDPSHSLNISYQGMATIYTSYTFGIVGLNTHVCAVVSGQDCDWAHWDPSRNLLVVVSNAQNVFSANREMQMGLYSVGIFEILQNVQWQGPSIGDTTYILGNAHVYGWPALTYVPIALPGNSAAPSGWVPTAPTSFSG
jgi:hypothetical protein